jgi:hypothetical protein
MALAEAPSTHHPLLLMLWGSTAMGLAATFAVWPTDLKKSPNSHKLVADLSATVKKKLVT